MHAHDEVDEGRRRHYGDFYDGVRDDGRPVGVVMGNCQAESLRVALAATGVDLVRTPPIHELVEADMPPLHALLTVADVVVVQPVRDDYHGLPIGTRQLLAATSAEATAVVPVIRFTGLHPTQAIVRPPSDPGATPPIVPYHDLRTLSEAAGRSAGSPPTTTRAVREEAAASMASLREREQRHGAVAISDVLTHPSFDQMRTINHPGTVVFEALAKRVAERLRLPEAPQPVGRALLDGIHAPREQVVIDAWDLDEVPRAHWLVGGREVDADEVRAAHREWYARRPDVVAAGVERHGAALERLGL